MYLNVWRELRRARRQCDRRSLVRQRDGSDTCKYVRDQMSIGYSGRYGQTDLHADWRCNGIEAHTTILGAGANADSTIVLSGV